MNSKKVILLFGAGGSIGSHFLAEYQKEFKIVPVYKKKFENRLNCDFENDAEIEGFASKISQKIDGVVFAQGLNPKLGFNQITKDHFHRMLNINLTAPTLLLQGLLRHFNPGCSIVFISSIAKKKGSYDPSYAAAKSGMVGLMYSLSNAMQDFRFNMVSLGLVQGSRVEQGMTKDFMLKHSTRMFNNDLVKVHHVSSVIRELIINTSMNKADIAIDGGYN